MIVKNKNKYQKEWHNATKPLNDRWWIENRGYQRDVAYLSSIDQSGVGVGRLLTK
jgi:hypothetical protein